MFDVLTTNIVLSIRGDPGLDGSSRCGNSVRTSVISFPLSPQPIYTTTSTRAYLASVCSVTVFPVPNPPGKPAFPPSAIGNNVSRIL